MTMTDLLWFYPDFEPYDQLVCLTCMINFHRNDLTNHVHWMIAK